MIFGLIKYVYHLKPITLPFVPTLVTLFLIVISLTVRMGAFQNVEQGCQPFIDAYYLKNYCQGWQPLRK